MPAKFLFLHRWQAPTVMSSTTSSTTFSPFWMARPFLNILYWFFPRWMSEIIKDLGDFPSLVSFIANIFSTSELRSKAAYSAIKCRRRSQLWTATPYGGFKAERSNGIGPSLTPLCPTLFFHRFPAQLGFSRDTQNLYCHVTAGLVQLNNACLFWEILLRANKKKNPKKPQ